MKLTAIALAIAAALVAATAAAQDHRWIARGRAMAVLPDDDCDPVANTGTVIAVADSGGAGVAATYRFRRTWGLEFGLSWTPLDLSTEGGQAPDLEVGSVDLLSAALVLQFHFRTQGRLHPYLGIGTTLGRLAGYSLTPDMESVGLSGIDFSTSLRLGTQFGVDLEVGKGWLVNLDLQYIPMTTQVNLVQASGASLDKVALQINPITISLGIARTL